MYRHLLVPIDHSDLSTVTVGRAVEFAFTLGARITFFHAQQDPAGSLMTMSDAALLRVTAPDDYAYSYEGRALELLTKAESAARARGVPCSTATAAATADAPAAILAAAREAGCDLIFMASHGRSSKLGMLLGSQTLKVLLGSEIPVLVSATNDPPVPAQAIAIIRDEHRSLAAVLHAWQHLFSAAGGKRPDAALMQAMLRYVQEFPLALHHPKEDEYLFRRLRERTAEADAELDELERQHARDRQLVADLAVLVGRYAAGAASAAEMEKAVADYAQATWEHMGREEGVVVPMAQRHLTPDDWAEIHDAFAQNGDPRFGGDTDAEFKRLFSRIVNLVPPAA